MAALEKFLEIADVPILRKDITQPQNIKWLKYNMWIRNRNLPEFKEAEDELNELFKKTFNFNAN